MGGFYPGTPGFWLILMAVLSAAGGSGGAWPCVHLVCAGCTGSDDRSSM